MRVSYQKYDYRVSILSYGKRLVLLMAAASLGMGSGCSYISRGAKATKDWFYGIGEKMPVSSNRCDNTFFCFGDDGRKRPELMMPKRVPAENRQGTASSSSAPMMFASPGVTGEAPAARRAVPPPMEPPVPPFPPPPGMMMEKPPMPPMPPGAMSGNLPPPPPPYVVERMQRNEDEYSESVEQGRMKPWEMSPEWEKDVEPTPFDNIEKQINW